jgi:hypothetical protein
MVMLLLVSQMSQDEIFDRVLIKLLNQKNKEHYELLKNVERAQVLSLRKIPLKQASSASAKKKTEDYLRTKKPLSEVHKLSLGFLFKPLSEMTRYYGLGLIYEKLKSIYQDKISQEFFDQFIKAVIEQNPKELSKIKLKDQKMLFELLTHAQCPLGDFLTLEVFENKTLFYYSCLQIDLFEAMFGENKSQAMLDEELEFRKTCSLKHLPKEKAQALILKQAPLWQRVYIEELIGFKVPQKKVFKAQGTLRSEYFYLPIDSGSSQ